MKSIYTCTFLYLWFHPNPKLKRLPCNLTTQRSIHKKTGGKPALGGLPAPDLSLKFTFCDESGRINSWTSKVRWGSGSEQPTRYREDWLMWELDPASINLPYWGCRSQFVHRRTCLPPPCLLGHFQWRSLTPTNYTFSAFIKNEANWLLYPLSFRRVCVLGYFMVTVL